MYVMCVKEDIDISKVLKGLYMDFCKERREIEQQKYQLEKERKEFSRYMQAENRRMEQQEQLFEMKFKVLEEELRKLADEKAEMEKKKAYYERLENFERGYQQAVDDAKIVRGELFFRGVENRLSLKKRYKDLIKIYHPDNIAGDNATVLEINKQYDYLCKVYG